VNFSFLSPSGLLVQPILVRLLVGHGAQALAKCGKTAYPRSIMCNCMPTLLLHIGTVARRCDGSVQGRKDTVHAGEIYHYRPAR
jgi:hypothetical protein